MKYSYVIWDWNGTLLDDVSASLSSVNDMLAARGLAPIGIDRYRQCIDVPIINFYKHFFDLEKEDYAAILAEYNSGYLFHLKDCGIAAGAVSLLSRFGDSGAKQVIVSSSNNDQLTANVRKYGVESYFDAVLGSRDYFAHSKIERAVDYLNSHPPGRAVVIGDLIHDCEMAEQIGADCFLLTTGHEDRERLSASGAQVVNGMDEIEKILFAAY